MKSLVSDLEHFFFGHPDHVNLDQRFVHIVCLVGGLVSVISIPVNYFVVTGWVLTVTNIVEAVILLSAYTYSRLTGRYDTVLWTTLLSILAFLSVQWFYNAGSSGGAQYYFTILALVGSSLLQGFHRFLFIMLIIVSVSVLVFTESFHPEWVRGYESQEARVIDIAFSLVVSLALVGVAVSALSNSNKKLLFRIEQRNRELIKDLTISRLLQEELFEVNENHIKGYDFAMLYRPSIGVGGDFYEISPLQGGLRVMLGDMKGHGISAALSAMVVKSEWSHLGLDGMAPGEALISLNERLVEHYRGATILCACVADIYPDRVLFSSGGFPPQFITDGKTPVYMNASGPMLGVGNSYKYRTETFPFQSNARVFLYSDALSEEFDQEGKIIGFQWLEEFMKRRFSSSSKLLETVVKRFYTMTGKEPGNTTDDLTIIVVGPSNSEHIENETVLGS